MRSQCRADLFHVSTSVGLPGRFAGDFTVISLQAQRLSLLSAVLGGGGGLLRIRGMV